MTRQQRRAAGRVAEGHRPAAPQPWRRLVIAGAAVVLGGVAFWQWSGGGAAVREGAPSWSPDGARIAFYAESQDGKSDLFVMDADGGRRRALLETPASEGAPAFSPDGTQIAYDTDRDGNFEIYVIKADGTGPRRLTSSPSRDLAPAWSPDGQWIVFMSDRDASPEFDVYRMSAADGSGVERLTSGATHWFPQYSPDGTKIAMHVWRDVNILDLGTRALTRLTTDPANGMYPTWSPDGKRIAFMSWRTGPTELYVMNADGGEQRTLVRMRSGSALDPRWSPKGDRIVFVHVPETSVHDTQRGAEAREIYTVDVATGNVTRLSR